MRRVFLCSTLTLLLTAFLATSVFALKMFPLEPPDTSSPRATLESFLRYSKLFYEAMRAPEEDEEIIDEALERAQRCFDLSEVAPSIREDVALESVLRLREIFDRISLPDKLDVPDKKDVKLHAIELWRIPHTDIKIGKAGGARLGAYLFTPDTVDQLDEFYDEVRSLPYKDDEIIGVYEEYIYSSGWLIPEGLIGRLPSWMREGYLGQAVWQWVGLLVLFSASGLLLWPLFIWRFRREKDGTLKAGVIVHLAFPLLVMALCLVLKYLVDFQINITGRVLSFVVMGLEVFFSLFAAWTILATGNIITDTIISAQRISKEALNADVIKLVCRLASLALVFVLFYQAGSYFGLPVTAVFASAGIAGVAVALAARETLANFFGGVSIFMDRPFRAGDYIVLDSGERGEVKAVGMRSTRLLTRDDILITIPNSVITNIKIVNQSAPKHHFRVRIKIGIAYGSDLDTVETVLLSLAENHPMVMRNPAARVRLRGFGESSINYELLVWAKCPQDRGRLIHELSRQVYRRFSEEGIEIPFPQRVVHLQSGESQ